MRGSDRTILIALPILALLVGLWLLVLGPKRTEAGDLQTDIDALRTSISATESQLAAAEEARDDFPKAYAELILLGRAVPEDGDQASLLFDFADLGKANDVDFISFEVTGDSDGGSSTPAPAAATEASAAALPLGATVGPAGLPVTPYAFTFNGNFFNMADFFGAVDGTVKVKNGEPEIEGRLATIDSFVMTSDPDKGFPRIQADFNATTYIVPPAQGLSAGATPAGPAPAASPQAAPVSTAPEG